MPQTWALRWRATEGLEPCRRSGLASRDSCQASAPPGRRTAPSYRGETGDDASGAREDAGAPKSAPRASPWSARVLAGSPKSAPRASPWSARVLAGSRAPSVSWERSSCASPWAMNPNGRGVGDCKAGALLYFPGALTCSTDRRRRRQRDQACPISEGRGLSPSAPKVARGCPLPKYRGNVARLVMLRCCAFRICLGGKIATSRNITPGCC